MYPHYACCLSQINRSYVRLTEVDQMGNGSHLSHAYSIPTAFSDVVQWYFCINQDRSRICYMRSGLMQVRSRRISSWTSTISRTTKEVPQESEIGEETNRKKVFLCTMIIVLILRVMPFSAD